MQQEEPLRQDSLEREIRERLMGCIALEHSMSELYTMMAERYPQESAFFNALAEEEVTHALTLEAGELIGKIGHLDDQLTPPAARLVQGTMVSVERAKADIATSAMSLADALKTALMLESTTVERFYIQVADESKGTPWQKYMLSIIADEQGHIDRIRTRMLDLGISKHS